MKKRKTNEIGRQSTKRRKVLKNAVVASGAVIAAKTVPSNWSKPVVDAVLLPAHAQTSAGTMEVNWVIGDDAPGGSAGIMNGTELVGSDFLYDDGTSMSFQALLTPPAAVDVSADIQISGTNFGAIDTPISTVTASADSGLVNLGSDYSSTNSDWGDSPGVGSVTVTFKATGYENAVITLALA